MKEQDKESEQQSSGDRQSKWITTQSNDSTDDTRSQKNSGGGTDQDDIETFNKELGDFHALEEEMATHSSVLAWRIPGKGEPGGLPSMGSHRVRDNWSDLAAAAAGDL